MATHSPRPRPTGLGHAPRPREGCDKSLFTGRAPSPGPWALGVCLLALLLPACQRRVPPQDPVDKHLASMRRAISNNDPDAALTALDKAIDLRPDDAELRLTKAQLLFDTGRLEPAARVAGDAVDMATQQALEAASQASDATIRFSKEQATRGGEAKEAAETEDPRTLRDRLAEDRGADTADAALADARAARDRARSIAAHGQFLKAASLRSLGRPGAEDALEQAKQHFDRLIEDPLGRDDAARAEAALSAMLHRAAILRLRGHTRSAVFQVQQIEARFPQWAGADTWIALLEQPDFERKLYDLMIDVGN